MTEELSFPGLPSQRRSFLTWLGTWYRLRGRATRKQFWLLTLAVFGGAVALGGLGALAFHAADPPRELENVIAVVFGVLVLMSEAALFCTAVRRMHDIGRRGHWLLILFVPFSIGFFWLLWLLITPSQQARNEYGPLR